MMKNDTGGPAFPMLGYVENGEWEPYSQFTGITLRDYFAAKAMQGMYANSCDDYEFKGVAEAAYRTADAMIAERNK